MTSLQPRPAYSQEELKELYPAGLQLQLVQIFFRHGERTPEQARFQNTGLPALWPYCTSARQLTSVVLSNDTPSSWSRFEWQRRLETLEDVNETHYSREVSSSICDMSEVTDKGRSTTLDVGRRLRRLYVDQLGFLPKVISSPTTVYLRSSPFPRALVSLQQAFTGLYPVDKRDKTFPKPTIVTRRLVDENLMPNEDYCPRFIQLSKAFSQRTAERWDSSNEMDYLNTLIRKWMPGQQRVAVNSQPKLHGIFDTINSTLAAGSQETRLPLEFYDARARKIIDRIVMEEEYSGYKESLEYRTVGIGALLSEVVQRMVRAGQNSLTGASVNGNENPRDLGDEESSLKLALFSGHDSTLAAILASLGAMSGEDWTWPSYTSSMAVELFRGRRGVRDRKPAAINMAETFSQLPKEDSDHSDNTVDLYVRIRYNDRAVEIPGCRAQGLHLDGEKHFCTLRAFKKIVDRFTPTDWKQACLSNLDNPVFLPQHEPSDRE